MWTVEKIRAFYESLNQTYGLAVRVAIRETDKGKFPLFCKGGELRFVPTFFNHPLLTDQIRMMLLAELYSAMYLDRQRTGYVDVNPGFMAKGICDELGVEFVSDGEMEQQLRVVRRQLYDDVENGCYFSVGDILRESGYSKYEVVDILRCGQEATIITVKPIGCRLGDPNKMMSEEELFDRCCNFRDMRDERVDMRRNLVVISGPSGVGKDTVVKKLLEKHPHLHKTVSVTTRAKRSEDKDGIDYYFVSKEQFYEYQTNGSLAEYTLYDGNYYGTLFSEVERHDETQPLLLVIDVGGRRDLRRRYPLAKSIFILPPSPASLKERIVARGENTEAEIKRRLEAADKELEQAPLYDYTVVNDDADTCAEHIAALIWGDAKNL